MAYQVNPLELIRMIKEGKNPQQLLISILEGEAGSTPMGANLLELAKIGRADQIEKFARNVYQERGLDFDKEFTAFKQQFGL